MTFLELAEKVIRDVNKPLTANEIWEKAVEMKFEQELDSKGKTPWATLGAKLYVDVRDNSYSKFQPIGKRPIKFWLKDLDNSVVHDEANSIIVKPEKFTERDLHPLLVKFADTSHHFRGTKLKTIFHECSKKSKKGTNMWLHPDLVGIYFPFNDKIRKYEEIIIDFQNKFSIFSTTK